MMNGTPITPQGILFDMDGVLIDSEPIHEVAMLELTERLGRRLEDMEVLLSLKGVPETVAASRLQALFPTITLSIEELVDLKHEIYTSMFERVRLIEGAVTFLEKSKALGRRIGLATSATRKSQELTFETFGLKSFFEAVTTGEDVKLGKPHPEPYERTAALLGLRPQDCLVIEDSLNGVKAGKAAGCVVVGITTTFTREELKAAGADIVVDSFQEIEA